MACTSITLNGVALDCGNVGGLKKVYIAPIDAVTGVTIDSTSGVTAIYMTGTKTFKEFSFRRGNANFVSTGNRDDAAGTYFVETVLTMQFNKMEYAKRNEMVSLVSAPCYIIAQDNNNLYWMIGYGGTDGYYASNNVTAQSGAQLAEGNFYTLTATAQTPSLPYEVIASAVETVI